MTPEIVKQLHKELNPVDVVYDGVAVKNRKEFEELENWLEKIHRKKHEKNSINVYFIFNRPFHY